MSLTFNGINCETLGLYVEKYPNRVAPRRKRRFISIPGRSGDLTETEDAYENVTVTYEVFLKVGSSFTEKCRLIAEWLLFPESYQILQDTYNTGFYREAVFEGPLTIEDELHEFGRAKLDFNCKPFLYDDAFLGRKIVIASTGQQIQIFQNYPEPFKVSGFYFNPAENPINIINPLNKKTKPKIYVIGNRNNASSGTITIGSQVISYNLQAGEIALIDSETENIIAGTEEGGYVPYNGNSLFSLSSFPELPTGSVDIDSTVNEIVIDPRWCTV